MRDAVVRRGVISSDVGWYTGVTPTRSTSAVSQTVEAAMRLCFYLNDDFVPHWQWLHHEFGKLPEALELGPVLDRFLAGENAGECAAVVPEIIDILTARLAEQGVDRAWPS